MSGILYLVGATLGGWIGWAIGERFGFMTAFFVSLVGSALGVYAARRITRHYFG
jgi:uncharacterized membrane protein YeaQ/YmgE (transglycosylase-associated protein family)